MKTREYLVTAGHQVRAAADQLPESDLEHPEHLPRQAFAQLSPNLLLGFCETATKAQPSYSQH
jgi:hypothetical protein